MGVKYNHLATLVKTKTGHSGPESKLKEEELLAAVLLSEEVFLSDNVLHSFYELIR